MKTQNSSTIPTRSLVWSSLGLVTLLLAGWAQAAEYEIGPGKKYASIGEAPLESLEAGDTVLVYWRNAPYKEKFIVSGRGTAEKPITVRGMPGPGGELPVIDGRDALTHPKLDFWNEDRSVIKIGAASVPAVELPSYIVLEKLDVRSARPPYKFTNRAGAELTYSGSASAIHVQNANHVTIRGCIMRDSANGLFAGIPEEFLVEGCYIHDNGLEGSGYNHNNYTAAAGMTFQFNHFGPLREGCKGSNLKDRSAGLVVRYNWIEGGSRQLDLVDAEDRDGYLAKDPRYHETYVYGNILIKPAAAGNSQVVHYGGDSSHREWYRKGILYFYNNTVISTRTDATTLCASSSNDEVVDCRNNIIYVTTPGSGLAISGGKGIFHLSHNWIKPGWKNTHEGSFTCVINDDGTNITGDAPGFADLDAQDFRLVEGSPCINAAAALNEDVLPDNDLLFQYVKHQAGRKRPTDAALDIGALEFPE